MSLPADRWVFVAEERHLIVCEMDPMGERCREARRLS